MKIPYLNISVPSVSWHTAVDLISDQKIYALVAVGAICMIASQQKLLETDPEFFNNFYKKSLEVITPFYNQLADYLADGKFIFGAVVGIVAMIFVHAFSTAQKSDVSSWGLSAGNRWFQPPFQEGQPVGLVNSGNTCWLNALLQMVINTPLKERFLQNQDPSFKKLRDLFTAYEQDALSKCTTSVSINTQAIREWIREEQLLDTQKFDFIVLSRRNSSSSQDFFNNVFNWIDGSDQPVPTLLPSVANSTENKPQELPSAFQEAFSNFKETFVSSEQLKKEFKELIENYQDRNFDEFFNHIFDWFEFPTELKNGFFEQRRPQLFRRAITQEEEKIKKAAAKGKTHQSEIISQWGQEDPSAFFEYALVWTGLSGSIQCYNEGNNEISNERAHYLRIEVPNTESKNYFDHPEKDLELQDKLLPHYFSYEAEPSPTGAKNRIIKQFKEAPKDLVIKVDRTLQLNTVTARETNTQDPNTLIRGGKFRNLIDHPERIEVPGKCVLNQQEYPKKSIYTCDAFIIHPGFSKDIDSGHFKSYVKRFGKWWECDDNTVSFIPDNKITEFMKRAYFLHYSLLEEVMVLPTDSSVKESAAEIPSVDTTPVTTGVNSPRGSDSESGSVSPHLPAPLN